MKFALTLTIYETDIRMKEMLPVEPERESGIFSTKNADDACGTYNNLVFCYNSTESHFASLGLYILNIINQLIGSVTGWRSSCPGPSVPTVCVRRSPMIGVIRIQSPSQAFQSSWKLYRRL